MLNSKQITKLFTEYNKLKENKTDNNLNYLVRLILKINKELWELEDSARMSNLGSRHVAQVKKAIDQRNQDRNDIIKKVDIKIYCQMKIVPLNKKLYYSESPGMVIDRLTILHIKLSKIRDLIQLIKEKDLKKEYREKEKIVNNQFNNLCGFLDLYFIKLEKKKVYFEIQQPVKIYNDDRIKKYIKKFFLALKI